MDLNYLLYFCKKGKVIIWIISDEEKSVYKVRKINEEYALVEDLKNKENKNIRWEEIENKIKKREWIISGYQQL